MLSAAGRGHKEDCHGRLRSAHRQHWVDVLPVSPSDSGRMCVAPSSCLCCLLALCRFMCTRVVSIEMGLDRYKLSKYSIEYLNHSELRIGARVRTVPLLKSTTLLTSPKARGKKALPSCTTCRYPRRVHAGNRSGVTPPVYDGALLPDRAGKRWA